MSGFSFPIKPGCHDIAEKLLKVTINKNNHAKPTSIQFNLLCQNIPFAPSHHFFIGVISLTMDKLVPVPCKSNGQDKEFYGNFLIIRRYSNFVTKNKQKNRG